MRQFLIYCSVFTAIAISASARAEVYNWPQWQGPQRNCLTSEKGLIKTWPEGAPKLRWLNDKCGTGYSGPAIVDGRLYIMGARDGEDQLIAIDADTGAEFWAAPISPEFHNDWGDGPRGTPAFDGERLFALSGSGTLVCIDAKSGREVWRTNM